MKNKFKSVSFFTLMLVLSSALSAQLNDDFADRIVFGIKGGLNSSNVYDEKGEDFEGDAKLGFVAGGFVGIPLGTFLGIQPEVLYSQKGYQSSGTVLLQSYTFTRTTNHLDIPIQLQLKPVSFLTILAGPQFSYLLSSKSELKINDNSGIVDEDDFDNDNPRKNMLGFVGGVDINISNLVIGGRAGWYWRSCRLGLPRQQRRWNEYRSSI